jgi:glycosyltransferase involved in cell wall biosynthesis
MRILLLAPLPPPTGGHSLAAKVLLDDLVRLHEVQVVNLNKESMKDGEVSIKRVLEVARILTQVWRERRNADVIYFTISESFAGNIKDLLIYTICSSGLAKMYIHLHGGSIGRLLFDRHRILARINRVFIRRLAGVIVSGQSHLTIFRDLIHRSRIHVVPNFAQDCLFVTERQIVEKFSNMRPVKILFISNLIPQKGFNELADAFFRLADSVKRMVRIEFAGRFDTKSEERMFLGKIAGIEQICYHGIVDDAKKQSLFSQAHIFCLPTALCEGQPISILEAYASGCVVLTTGQGGIRDIFADGVNGFKIQERSSKSIKSVLEGMIRKPKDLLTIALANRRMAGEKYRTAIFNASLRAIIESAIPRGNINGGLR